jgi:ADP-ribose pyrophosphatase YjhB (NUDIX family)
VHEGGLLVIRKGGGPYRGLYDLPGGTIEAHESVAEAVHREFAEETGVTVHIVKQAGVCDYLVPYPLPKRGTSHIHHLAIFYVVQYDSGRLLNRPESFEGQDSLGALWVPLHELSSSNSSPLVLNARDWLQLGELPLHVQRLDNWKVLL